ncbi:hypothetical protein Q0Z83_017890 [Actinoplanes sichuanensis]|uniref:Uncharacterized protein n=1 Tax=Actinoplanes sichuanensis TaxID=512349 RepID=A0ABW4A750_9ACTN|nr:hypothetical protein [Actinoplanes sichuanensis]BEL03598.1 hypothetical protein Q0Z83_017890 [Actinoplanes sichuanensis]
MGIYLVSVSAAGWAEGECGPLLDEALGDRGRPAYPGPPAGAADFEEKLIPPMDAFAEVCERHGVGDVLNASLLVPVDFPGLIELPVATSFDDVTNVVSAQWLRAAMAPIAAEAGLPGDLPTGPLALTLAIEDPLLFYVALFRQAAEHSLRYGCPLTYV